MLLTRAFWVLSIAVALLLVVTIWPLILIGVFVGVVAVTASANALVARVVGRDLGCLVGGLVALGWLWLLAAVSDDGSATALAVGLLLPICLIVLARRFGSDRPAADQAP